MKDTIRKILSWLRLINKTISSLIMVFVFSRKTDFTKNKANKKCIVLGNGPSLAHDLENKPDIFSSMDSMCVNFFAFSEYYEQIKPKYYVILDPNFWQENLSEGVEDRDRFLDVFVQKTSWNLTLYMPHDAKNSTVLARLINCSNIKTEYFNRTPVDGFSWFRHFLYKRSLGMPLAQNVLVASVFLALNLEYEEVYIVGADHSWHEEIEVGKDNVLYVRQKHFYDSEEVVELKPFFHAGDKGVFNIYQVFDGWAKLFYSYMLLRKYADELGVKIYNASSKTYVDAFERADL